MKGKRFRPGDGIIIVLVLALAAAIAGPYLLAPSQALYCEVQQDGALVRRVRLAEGYQEHFEVQGGIIKIEIDGRRARIAQAECPDQVCVHTGWLTHSGRAAVCLPNRVVLKLTGVKEVGDIDAIAS